MSTGSEHETQSLTRDSDLCVRCGYDLRGIADDQACSECGLLAERSRNPSEHLADAPPWLIRRLAIGARLLLWAVMCALGGMAVLIGGEFRLSYTVRRILFDWILISTDLAAILWTIGAWMLTSRGPPSHLSKMPRRIRLGWRIFSVFLLVLVLLAHAEQKNLHISSQVYDWFTASLPSEIESWLYELTPYVVIFFIWLIPSLNSVFGFLWLRRLAQRVLNSNLAEHSAIVGVGLCASSGLFIFCGLSQQWLESIQPFTNKTWASIEMAGLTTLLACLITCALWSLLNLLRFSIAFRRAASEASSRWKRADRAAQ